ncbi:cystathionine beta-lyase [Rouxiella badensis]|jgi:cystathionine beta-lyase|uniref:Cystathionine beta-lyase n=1 Tax=Rouxiella badensis TaxID=1646377 RepID=A0A1X0WJ08_9GAMM|nr:cystathionine beta-lyase [Rouxiella badensis]MCC3703655.1 cystathionine beta-lyase [Rouxiella badensis]MCC3720483.1 cystathionine beta-lyase [Rouxiella badensis]MCC3730322.1 cystathionine beta-lyase [Rouxiella badensis]MCC3734502.1 cystathionine beta-lyase [Rouxiella badensis]MCC3742236.1 cystathionine beta-lyase [Rouxiella badensis]
MKRCLGETDAAPGIDSRLTHAGRCPAANQGFVNTPLYRGSTVLAPTVDDLLGYRQPFVYGRLGSPTTVALQETLRSLDNSAGVVLCPSGLAAISTALMSCLTAGDHLLMTDAAYRPARTLCEGVLRRSGVETTYFDPLLSGEALRRLIRQETRAIYLEVPGSQSMEVSDIAAIVAVAREFNLLVIMDNTWATPLFFDAIGHGADLVVQAGTKYICGHSDVMIGMVSASPRALAQLQKYYREIGMCVSPDDAWLTLRGLRTLGVRLRQHQENALRIATWLATRPEVQCVWYPALEGDPGHSLWARDFTGASSLFSVVLQPASNKAVSAFLEGLRYFGLGYSWGGFESLVLPFDCTAYRSASSRKPVGPCVRFYIGLEDVNDLTADLEAGFVRFNAAWDAR